jgi:YbbR domain-containing protein
MNNWIVNNFWIKIVSLILAIITWFYVNEELIKEKKMAKQLYKSSVVSQIQNPSYDKKPVK